jgi:hypothetical protein
VKLVKTPFERFEDNLEFAQRMINGGLTLEQLRASGANLGELTGPEAPHPDDLYRGAWTQAVTALDHWLHEAIIDYVVELTNNRNWSRPDRLKKLAMPFGVAEQLSGDQPSHAVIRAFLQDELTRSTYQRSAAITDGLRLALHTTGDQIWATIGAGAPHCLSSSAAMERQNNIVDRRNRIAHRADLNEQGQRIPMSADEVQEALDWIRHVGTVAAQLLH